MMSEQKQYNYDVHAGRLFCLFMVLNAINLFVKQSLSIAFLTNNITIILGIIYMIYFATHINIFRASVFNIIIWEFVLILLIALSIFRYPDSTSAIIKRCIWTVAFCIPMFCVGRKIKDYDLFFSQVRFGCAFVLIIALYQFIRHMGSSGAWFDYDVSISYALAFPTIFHISRLNEKKIYYPIVVLEIAIILLYGSRGPLLCIGSYMLIRVILAKPKSVKMQLLRIIVMILIIVMTLGYEYVINIIVELFQNLGINSRTLSLLARSKITNITGRDYVWEMVIEKIKEKPYLGWGIAGDQSFMVSYPHQLFLELALHFGLIIGALLGLTIVYRITRKLVSVKFQDKALVAFFCTGFIPLMLSDTYLDNVYFWILLGLCWGSKISFSIRGSK